MKLLLLRLAKHPAAAAVMGVLVALFGTRLLNDYACDQPMLWPIIRDGAEPGLYAPEDLLVAAGRQGPYHVYHLASWLYANVSDFGTAWFLVYVVFLYAAFWGWWRLALVVGASKRVAHLVVLLMAAMPPFRGTLNWSWSPTASMLSLTAGLPFMLFGLVAVFERQRLRTVLLALATFTVHPGLGVILMACASVVAVLDPEWTHQQKAQLLLGLAAGVLPNGLFIAWNSGHDFSTGRTCITSEDFFAIFDRTGFHAYIGQHWSEGYAFFALLAAGAVCGAPQLEVANLRRAKIITACCGVLLAAYVLNLYLIRYPGGVLLFLFRVTLVLKPLFLTAFMAGVLAALSRGGATRQNKLRLMAAVAFLICSALVRDLRNSEVLLLGALGILLMEDGSPTLPLGAVLLLAAVTQQILLSSSLAAVLDQVADGSNTGLKLAQGVVDKQWGNRLTTLNVGLGMLACVWLSCRRKGRVLAAGPILFPSTLGAVALLCPWVIYLDDPKLAGGGWRAIQAARAVAQPMGEVRALMEWFSENTPRDSMVLIPPADPRFINFRTAAGRSAYVTALEVPQLSYDLSRYAEGFRRLEEVGAIMQKAGWVDPSGYDRLSVDDLRRLRDQRGVDLAVFSLDTRGPQLAALTCTVQINGLCVVDLRSALP